MDCRSTIELLGERDVDCAAVALGGLKWVPDLLSTSDPGVLFGTTLALRNSLVSTKS